MSQTKDEFYATLLRGDCLCLVSNARLALTMQERVAATQEKLGVSAWLSPTIFTVSAWLQHVTQMLPFDPFLTAKTVLTQDEEVRLWRTVIQSNERQAQTLSFGDVSRLAQQAHEGCTLYDTWPSNVSSLPEQERFCTAWLPAFQRLCLQHNFITSAQHEVMLLNTVLKSSLLPKVIFYAGFDDVPPLLLRLFDTARSQAVVVQSVDQLFYASSQPQLIRPENSNDELRLIASWCRHQLALDPKRRVGVVLPRLQDSRNAVLRAVVEEVECHRVGRLTDDPYELVNISAGLPLSDYAIVDDALRLMSVLAENQSISNAEMSALLLSSTLFDPKESGSRAACDAWLRDKSVVTQSLSAWLKVFQFSQKKTPFPNTLAQIISVVECVRNAGSKCLLSEWSRVFVDVISIARKRWPSDRSLSSAEFQTLQAFNEVWQTGANSIVPMAQCSSAEFVDVVRSLARGRLFQPQQPGTARVQICGVLEAAALDVDAVWLAGMTDDEFPAPIKPNPLLPIVFQREHNFPRSNHQREQQFASVTLHRLLHLAPEVMVSCCRLNGDSDVRPSPLLASYSLTTVSTWDVASDSNRPMHTDSIYAFESLHDVAPTLSANEPIRRDAHLLGAQAVNPQAAFIEFRLHATPVSPLPILRAQHERGSLIHAALESAFAQLTNSEQLKSMSDDDIGLLANQSANVAVQKLLSRSAAILPPNWLALETECVAQNVAQWIRYEKLREQPWHVVAREQNSEVSFGDLTLNLRIDRIDTVEQGLVVIDYKIGSSWKQPAWLVTRMADPQLPLYAIAQSNPVAAIVAGRVRPKSMQFQGVSDPGVLPISDNRAVDGMSLAQLTPLWRERLDALAAEFCAGVANNETHDDREVNNLSAFPCLRLHAGTEEDSE